MQHAPSLEDETLLGNPYWSALCTEQAPCAIGGPLARRFPADVIPFAGLAQDSEQAVHALHELLAPGEIIFVTARERLPPSPLQPLRVIPGWQMVLPHASLDPAPPALAASMPPIEPLHREHIPEMLALKAVAFPGFFGPRAATLGNFFGIRAGATLVAMAGERLALPGWREVSAVCTHPGHTGHGYAAALLRHLLRSHAQAGLRSFLGVTASNTGAITLYGRLGFINARPLTWRELQRPA